MQKRCGGDANYLEAVKSLKTTPSDADDVTEDEKGQMAMTSRKPQRRSTDSSCGVATVCQKCRDGILHQPDAGRQEEYMWEANQVLCDDGGLVDTQLGCQRHGLGSDPTIIRPVPCSSVENWLSGIRA